MIIFDQNLRPQSEQGSAPRTTGILPVLATQTQANRPSRWIILPLVFILFTQPGCSVSMSLGKKPQPAPAPVVSPVTAQNLHTTLSVPADAQRIAEGSDPVRLIADTDGTVYVFSRDDRQVSLQYDLQSGETFTLSPADAGTAFTADRHAGAPGRGTLPPSKGGYEIYFLRKGTTTTSPAKAPPLP